jgi:hypothetical protein
MPEAYKVLDKRIAGTSAATHYTPGTGKQAVVKHISFTNQTGAAVTVNWYRNGTAAGDLVMTFTVAANSAQEWEGTAALSATDTLAFSCGTASACLVVIDGLEIS